jgi:dolichol-phosphate mannosyltransferase
VVRVADTLTQDPARATVAVACGWGFDGARQAPGVLGGVLQRLTGSADPFSGLVGVTRAALQRRTHPFDAAGSWFALELLAKVPGGRREVAAARPARGPMADGASLGDLRHFKKLADHRYGNLSRLVQFCLVGASGMVVDLSCYALFQWLLRGTALAGRALPGLGPLDLAASAFLAVGLALTWNFSLNRRLTFSYARHGSLVSQFLAYVAGNLAAISVNLLIRLRLPQYVGFFDDHKLAAAVIGIVLATGISFSMSRWVVFRKQRNGPDPKPCPRRRAVRLRVSAEGVPVEAG